MLSFVLDFIGFEAGLADVLQGCTFNEIKIGSRVRALRFGVRVAVCCLQFGSI